MKYRFTLLLLSLIVLPSACNKKQSAADNAPASGPAIAFGGNDVTPEGAISMKALQQLEQRSSEPTLNVNFIRTPLSDAGLQQLSKFHNLRRIEAIGSRVTPQGIQKLKSAVPEVEVVH
jgi:hypothetical protein